MGNQDLYHSGACGSRDPDSTARINVLKPLGLSNGDLRSGRQAADSISVARVMEKASDESDEPGVPPGAESDQKESRRFSGGITDDTLREMQKRERRIAPDRPDEQCRANQIGP
jgi:hypothetical protein